METAINQVFLYCQSCSRSMKSGDPDHSIIALVHLSRPKRASHHKERCHVTSGNAKVIGWCSVKFHVHCIPLSSVYQPPHNSLPETSLNRRLAVTNLSPTAQSPQAVPDTASPIINFNENVRQNLTQCLKTPATAMRRAALYIIKLYVFCFSP